MQSHCTIFYLKEKTTISGKSPLPSSPSVQSSTAAVSRSPSSQSDWLSHGGNSLGPMPSTLSVGDYNKLLLDTKRLMSTHQLPYVAKLATDSSGDDSDRTNLTSNNTWNGSSNDVSLKSSTVGQCNLTNQTEKEAERDGIAMMPNSSSSIPNINQQQQVNQPNLASPTQNISGLESKAATASYSPLPQQSTITQPEHKVTNQQQEHKVTSQLPPLSPPSVKKQVGPKVENTNENIGQSKTLMVNGTKYQPANNQTGTQQRPSFLTNFPRPSSTCGSSPVPYSRVSSKSSPLSSSPKPFSPNLFKPIANSSPISSGTPTRHLFTPSPKILENCESTFSVRSSNQPCTEPEANSKSELRVRPKEPGNIGNVSDKITEDKNGLSNLLSEVDERIRFSLDIHPTQKLSSGVSNTESTKNTDSVSKDNLDDQTAKNMKEDLSKVKQDISELKNELTVTKQGLESGKQPLLVSMISYMNI